MNCRRRLAALLGTPATLGGVLAAVALTATPLTAAQPEKLDAAVAQLMAGQALTGETREDCQREFVAYFNELCRRNNAADVKGFSPEDVASHYAYALEMSVIDPDRHGGWPFRHDGRKAAFPALKKRVADSPAPVLLAAVIIPALDNGEIRYAQEIYGRLSATNEFWAHYILKIIQHRYYGSDAARQFLAGVYQADRPEQAGR